MVTNIILIVISVLLIYSLIPTWYYKAKTKVAWEGEEEKNIYLTFDDGPSKEYTPAFLDLLKEHQVPATFFIVGDFAEKNPGIIRRMRKEGHLVCVHSAQHKSLLLKGPKKTRKDLDSSLQTMESLGLNQQYYRPPWGHLNLTTLNYIKKEGWDLVLWDVIVGDWKKKATPESISRKIQRRVRSGSIVCLHDGRGASGAPLNTIEALNQAIPRLKGQGYMFKRVDEKYEEKYIG